jgi:hypothetical protein
MKTTNLVLFISIIENFFRKIKLGNIVVLLELAALRMPIQMPFELRSSCRELNLKYIAKLLTFRYSVPLAVGITIPCVCNR